MKFDEILLVIFLGVVIAVAVLLLSACQPTKHTILLPGDVTASPLGCDADAIKRGVHC